MLLNTFSNIQVNIIMIIIIEDFFFLIILFSLLKPKQVLLNLFTPDGTF